MRSLQENFTWMFIGNGVYAFTQWIQLLLITKLCTTTELGTFTFAIAIATPVFMFAGFKLRLVMIADVRNNWSFDEYFSLRTVSVFISFLIIIAIIILSGFNAFKFKVILIMALIKGIEQIQDIIYAKFQSIENMKLISISMMLRGTLVVVGLFAGIWFYQEFIPGILLMLLSTLCVMLLFDYVHLKKINSAKPPQYRFNKKRMFALVKKSFPMGIVLFLTALNLNVSKYFAEYYLGTDLQGIFSVILYVIVVGSLVIDAVGHALSPRMCRYIEDRNKTSFNKLKIIFMVIAVSIGILCFFVSLIWGEDLLLLLFSKEVSRYNNVFILLMASSAAIFLAEALGFCLTAMSVFKEQPYVYFIVALTNTILCYLFIKPFGLAGLVYAIFISSSINSILLFYLIYNKLNKLKKQNFCTLYNNYIEKKQIHPEIMELKNN